MSSPENIAAEERAHALLSASSSKIWLTCTPSARLAEQYADDGSDYAREGTAAHELAELLIRCDLSGNDGADIEDVKAFCEGNPFYGQEMNDAISGYVDYIMERYNAARATTPDAILITEQRLDYSTWVPEGFGTGDVIIIADGTMEVIDLKYGKGVPVSAEGNPQLKLYGAGAYAAFEMLYDIHTITITICQPRLDSISSDTLTAEELNTWMTDYVQPRAAAAWAGTGEYAPGDHCRFCNGLPHCKALADHNMELLKYDFATGNALDNVDIADILEHVDPLVKWAKAIQDYALDQAVNHEAHFPGWKVVEGRSTRSYIDQDKVATALTEAGYADAIIYERNLLGITAMEKAIGKKPFATLLNTFVQKPPGAPKLAPDTDSRKALGSLEEAAADFAD